MQSVAHMDAACTRCPPSSAARPCAPRLIPASDAITMPVRIPIYRPRPAPRSLLSPVGFAQRRPSASLCPCLVLPNFSSDSWHCPILVSMSGGFFRKGKRPRRLHSLSVVCPGPRPPLLDHASAIQDPPPPCFHDTIPVGRRSVGIIARIQSNPRM